MFMYLNDTLIIKKKKKKKKKERKKAEEEVNLRLVLCIYNAIVVF